MADDPQARYERDLALDPRVDSPAREGLTGTAGASVYPGERDPEHLTVAPDQRPREEQPRWRHDFAIDWPEDQYVARRDFARFLVLTSGAFVAGQGWIAAQSLVRKGRKPPERARIASLRDIAPGTAVTFNFPDEHTPCLLIRTAEGDLLAYEQKCTHLSCAVVPKLEKGVLHCPCHEGYFDLRTGQRLAGPPPRPLPKVVLEVEGDEVFAVAVETRSVG